MRTKGVYLGDVIKERHNVVFESENWKRMKRFARHSKHSVSFFINKATEAYKRTEIEDYHELKTELARKIDMYQRQMKAVEEAENASVESKRVV